MGQRCRLLFLIAFLPRPTPSASPCPAPPSARSFLSRAFLGFELSEHLGSIVLYPAMHAPLRFQVDSAISRRRNTSVRAVPKQTSGHPHGACGPLGL